MNLTDAAAVSELFGSVIVILGIFWGGVQLLRRIDHRLDRQDADTELVRQSVDDLRKQADKQFGGNGNGLREAVNAIRVDVSDIKTQTAENAANIAELRGAFNQSQRNL